MYPVFGLFKIDVLRKTNLLEKFVGGDNALLLKILHFGDVYVINENLMSIYQAGQSKKGMIDTARQFNEGSFGIIFPMFPLTKWCYNNLGKKIFFKNFDYFIQLNLWGTFSLIIDLVRIFLKHLYNK